MTLPSAPDSALPFSAENVVPENKARACLAYLLEPSSMKSEPGVSTNKGSSMLQLQEPQPKISDEELQSLGAEVERLAKEVCEASLRLEPDAAVSTLKGAVADLQSRLSVISSVKDVETALCTVGTHRKQCNSCGHSEVLTNRTCSEQSHMYCQECWASWDRCGWWRPSLRISNRPPIVRSGVPCFGPEDIFSVSGFCCANDDLSLFDALKGELPAGRDFSDWHGSRHMGMQFEGEGARHDSSTAPPALRAVVAEMEAAFGIRASASRLNLYRSPQDYKPLHYDRGRDNDGTPQCTVGASFGATRELTMLHVRSGVNSSFVQRNGDVFAFTPEINKVFMHGVPKIGYGSPSEVEGSGERLSLILWGSKVDVPRSLPGGA